MFTSRPPASWSQCPLCAIPLGTAAAPGTCNAPIAVSPSTGCQPSGPVPMSPCSVEGELLGTFCLRSPGVVAARMSHLTNIARPPGGGGGWKRLWNPLCLHRPGGKPARPRSLSTPVPASCLPTFCPGLSSVLQPCVLWSPGCPLLPCLAPPQHLGLPLRPFSCLLPFFPAPLLLSLPSLSSGLPSLPPPKPLCLFFPALCSSSLPLCLFAPGSLSPHLLLASSPPRPVQEGLVRSGSFLPCSPPAWPSWGLWARPCRESSLPSVRPVPPHPPPLCVPDSRPQSHAPGPGCCGQGGRPAAHTEPT